MSADKNLTQTLCWSCRNAVPDGIFGCSWAKDFTPVEGWDAKENKKRPGNYYVYKCPLFIPDPPLATQW